MSLGMKKVFHMVRIQSSNFSPSEKKPSKAWSLEIRPLVGTYYVLSIGDKEGRKEGRGRKKEQKKERKPWKFYPQSIAKTEHEGQVFFFSTNFVIFLTKKLGKV